MGIFFRGFFIILFCGLNSARAQSECQGFVEEAKFQLFKILPTAQQSKIDRIEFTCHIDNESDCNAIHYKDQVFLGVGNDRCNEPYLNKSIVVHEFGHSVYDTFINHLRVRSASMSESFSDILTTVLFNDSRVGPNFWKRSGVNYLRQLNVDYVFPHSARGTYSESLIFSSAVWRTFEVLKNKFDLVKAQSLILSSLLESLNQPSEISSAQHDLAQKFYMNLEYNIKALLPDNSFGLMTTVYDIFKSKGLLDYDEQDSNLADTDIKFDIYTETIELDCGDQCNIPDDGKNAFVINIPKPENLARSAYSKVELQLKVDHPLSHDLVIYFESGAGKVIAVYQGIEELPIADLIFLPIHPSELSGGKIIVEDTAPTMDGRVISASLNYALDSY